MRGHQELFSSGVGAGALVSFRSEVLLGCAREDEVERVGEPVPGFSRGPYKFTNLKPMTKKKDKLAQEAMKRTVAEEYALAKKEKRQPRCVYCGEPLELIQPQQLDIKWTWIEQEGCFRKHKGEGDADHPMCLACGAEDWDFVDEQEFIFY